MWGYLTETNNRTNSNNCEHNDLHRFPATTVFEVVNLMFDSGDIFWESWRFIAEDDIPILRHANEVVGLYVTPTLACTCMRIWIDYSNEPYIAARMVSFSSAH